MSLISIITVFLYLISELHGYYLSLSQLYWQNASNYCRQHCNSELASIHSYEEHQNIIKIINSNINYLVSDKHIWIGLHRNSVDHTTFEWEDNTIYNSTLYSPWKQYNPSQSDYCVLLDYDANWTFNDRSCNDRQHFLCNSCYGVITKYVLPGQYLTHTNAQNLCKNTYNTNLLSIHNDNEQSDTQFLLRQCSDSNSWIGLMNYKWDDGTTYDYNDGWKPGEPDNGYQCVAFDSDGGTYLWKDGNCNDNGKRQFLCNMPSELCYKYEWDIDNNSVSIDDIFDSESCDVSASNNVNRIGMYKKQWINMDDSETLVVEMVYTINNDSNSCLDVGITINYEYCNVYYYVGLNANDNLLYFRYIEVNTYDEILNPIPLNFTYEHGSFYALKIERLNGNHYNIYVNNVMYASVNDIMYNSVRNSSLSGYIGMINNNCSAIIKSLFVSGEQIYTNDSCKQYEIYPIVNTTIANQIPTQLVIAYGIYIEIVFEYNVLDDIIPTQVLDEISAILINVTQTHVHEETDCIESEYYNISGLTVESATVTATIFLCDEETESQLIAILDSGKLARDLLTKVNVEAILIVDINSVQIDFDVITEREEKEGIVITTTMDSVNENNANAKSDGFVWLLLAIIGSLIVVCIIGMCVVIIIWHKRHKINYDKNVDVINDSTTTTMGPGYSTKTKNSDNDSDKDEKCMDNNKNTCIAMTPNGENNDNKINTLGYYEVKQWLTDVVELPKYYDNFIDNGYESIEFIKNVNDNSELFEIGIESEIDQTVIMLEIKKLNKLSDGIENVNVNDNTIEGTEITTTGDTRDTNH